MYLIRRCHARCDDACQQSRPALQVVQKCLSASNRVINRSTAKVRSPHLAQGQGVKLGKGVRDTQRKAARAGQTPMGITVNARQPSLAGDSPNRGSNSWGYAQTDLHNNTPLISYIFKSKHQKGGASEGFEDKMQQLRPLYTQAAGKKDCVRLQESSGFAKGEGSGRGM